MSAKALEITVNLVTLDCSACGTVFAIPYGMHRRYEENGAWIRCPNPRCEWPSFHRTESEVQKLKKQLDSAVTSRRWAEQQLETERNSHRATRGAVTKVKKRVSHGVCPCCKRTFQNLARHMKSKHPEEVAT